MASIAINYFYARDVSSEKKLDVLFPARKAVDAHPNSGSLREPP
jgi:hypothetical protein